MRNPVLRGLAVGLVVFGSVAASHATEWMYCGDTEAVVEVGFLLGSIDAFLPAAITMRHKTMHWTSGEAYGEGAPITMGQGFADARTLQVDLFDENLIERVAELRLSRAEEGDMVVLAGTLRIPGQGVWAVACDAT
ncbi:hypothetical protein [Devosia sp.]|uniref:hypothetical protein n=1 Tax=Devosia sp. TaxID=1871048 RepID=UPI00292F778C|nr:hypothetical protein [Devosia sp.]